MDKNVGLYAARVVGQGNMKKELAICGPSAIVFDKGTGQFSLTLKTKDI